MWFVHDHPTPGPSTPIVRAQITYHKDLDATLYDDPEIPTKVTAETWAETCGDSAPLVARTTQGLHVLDGVLFITDADGVTSTRCAAGDTVLLPSGFAGTVDVLKSARTLVCTS